MYNNFYTSKLRDEHITDVLNRLNRNKIIIKHNLSMILFPI